MQNVKICDIRELKEQYNRDIETASGMLGLGALFQVYQAMEISDGTEAIVHCGVMYMDEITINKSGTRRIVLKYAEYKSVVWAIENVVGALDNKLFEYDSFDAILEQWGGNIVTFVEMSDKIREVASKAYDTDDRIRNRYSSKDEYLEHIQDLLAEDIKNTMIKTSNSSKQSA